MAKLLTYEQAKALGEIETKVKNHIKDNYPTLYYTKDKNILGRYGHSMSQTSWDKIERLSKNDPKLKSLYSEYKEKRFQIYNTNK